jgi:hypothetical protein
MIERLSADARVLLQPAATYRAIGLQMAASPASAWRAWRRPLFILLFIGACLSIAATGAVTLRITLSAALAWSFMPLIDIAALAVVLRGHERRAFRHVVDLFCSGFGAYLLWTLGIAVIMPCVPLRYGVPIFGTYVYGGAALAVAWSLYIDYCFFRDGLGRSSGAARRGLLLHRALAWAPILLIFGAPGIHTELLEWLGK